MLDEVASPGLGGMLDTCSVARAGERFNECADLLGPDLVHVHFADGRPSGHLVPGEGDLPLDSYLDELDRRRYGGALAFELYNSSYDFDPHGAMERALRFLRERLR